MSDRKLLMPKATAVWLVENTSLAFEQIAELCGLHVLEVKGIADGDVAQGIKGMDPISTGQLTREEIARGEEDHGYQPEAGRAEGRHPRRQEQEGAALHAGVAPPGPPQRRAVALRSHPELKDSQIMRLVGTTKPTIAAIRERTHWNSPNLQPQDPVTLGLCTQIDLDNEVKKAARRLERERKESGRPLEKAGTLLPTSQTIPGMGPQPEVEIILPKPVVEEKPEETAAEEEARVFATTARDGRHQDRRGAAAVTARLQLADAHSHPDKARGSREAIDREPRNVRPPAGSRTTFKLANTTCERPTRSRVSARLRDRSCGRILGAQMRG